MKIVTATLTALAILSAAPAMAENTVFEKQRELARLFNKDDGQARTYRPAPRTQAAVTSGRGQVISTTMPTGPERALMRLRATQPNTSGNGR